MILEIIGIVVVGLIGFIVLEILFVGFAPLRLISISTLPCRKKS